MREKNAIMHQNTSMSPMMSFLCYLFVLGSIASSDILWVKVLTNQIYRVIAQDIYICLVCIIIFTYYSRNKLKVIVSLESGFFIFTVLMLLLSAATTEDNIKTYLFKVALIIGGYYGAHLFGLENFYYTFRRIMMVLMLAALLLYIMKLTGVGYAALPVNRISTGVQYSTIGLANMYNSLFYQLPRAQSVFWEPGVYVAYLSILLMLELFYRDEIDKKYLFLVLVSIIITTSTTGYITSLISLISYILFRKEERLRTKVLITILLAVLILVVIFDETILYQLTSKFADNTESFTNRWLSIGGNVLAIKEAPILGLGPVKSQAVIEGYIRSQGGTKSFSNLNTILAHYAVFGLVPFLFYVFHVIKFSLSFKINLVGKILLLLAVVFLLSSTGYQYSPFFTLVFMFRVDDEVEHSTILEKKR